MFEWSDKFSIEVDVIDQQHQELFRLIKALHGAAVESQETMLKTYLDELVDYTRYHFKEEEKLMESVDYPRVDSHKEEHNNLTGKVVDFKSQLDQNGSVNINEFITFLFNWLVKHIMDRDKKIGDFIKLQKM